MPRAFAAQGAADPSSRESAEEWTVLEERPGEGEQCLVCGNAIVGDGIVEIRHQGRTFHVAKKMLGEFDRDPDAYFQKIQARSALFDEETMRPGAAPPLAGGWLIFGLYVLIGLFFGALCAYLAVSWGKAAVPWFFVGLVANLPGLIALLMTGGSILGLPKAADLERGSGKGGTLTGEAIPSGMTKVPTTRSPVSCPSCGAPNHPSASLCGLCGEGLDPSVEAETARV